MIGRLFRNSHGSARFASCGLIVGALALIAGLGWYALSTRAASAGLSALPDRVALTGSGVTFTVRSTEVFTLTVLHTNDTWGYVDPCG
jgi:hypothetical protein